MSADAPSVPSLEFLLDPALVIERSGAVLSANGPARRLLAAEPVGAILFDLSPDPRPELDGLLRRASASTSPTIGAVTFATVEGPRRLRLHAARLGTDGAGAVVLRLLSAEADQFAVLNGKVRELDRQLRQRLQEKAALEDALQSNRILLDELQHRVKNNIQIMMTLIRMSAEGRQSAEVAEVVAKAGLRLQAMASTQEAVYQSHRHGSVRSGAFLRDLVAVIGESTGCGGAIEVDIADLELDSERAHCLALIVNELVTNAGKHALRDGRGAIRVALAERRGEGLELTVSDDGPGMAEAAGWRHSGLHLVRSLCRQIGGSLDIASGDGTTCTVRFAGLEGRP